MTTLTINGEERHEIIVHEGQSVLDVLLAAQEKYWGESSEITGLAVNGEALEVLTEENLSSIEAQDKTIDVTISVIEARPIGDTLTEAADYLSQLETGFGALAEAIRKDPKPEAYKMLRDGLDGLSQMIGLVDNMLDAEADSEKKSSFSEFIEVLKEKSEEMTSAQQNDDPTMIADILEYEFVESVQELRAQVLELKEQNAG